MKKDLMAVLLLILGFRGFAFDFPLSVGGGVFLNQTYESYKFTEDLSLSQSTPWSWDSRPEGFTTRYGIFGIYGYFDIPYGEFLISFGGTHGLSGRDDDLARTVYQGGGPVLGFGFLGKYPFHFKDTLTAYPLLGIDSQVLLGAIQGDGKSFPDHAFQEAKELYTSLWFKLGIGVDFDFTEVLYFRANFLYGFKFWSKTENEFYDDHKSAIQAYAFHGPTFKLSVGYKIYTIRF